MKGQIILRLKCLAGVNKQGKLKEGWRANGLAAVCTWLDSILASMFDVSSSMLACGEVVFLTAVSTVKNKLLKSEEFG